MFSSFYFVVFTNLKKNSRNDNEGGLSNGYIRF
ncbi:hypothetical protein SAJ_0701 [Streptococcus agalactiae 18RS21]|nr:hypothetical protein SAJ_0701 [Streptococcus agalactiae 18RS21]